MADLSRAEHIARAAELLARSDHLIDHLDKLNQFRERRPYGTRKGEEETAARLAQVAGVHLKFADVLGQQPAEGVRTAPEPTPWIRVRRGGNEEWYRDERMWALRLDSKPDGPDRNVYGWLLFGPSCARDGEYIGNRIDGTTHAMRCADEYIARYQAGRS